jgi:hypothetical protein
LPLLSRVRTRRKGETAMPHHFGQKTFQSWLTTSVRTAAAGAVRTQALLQVRNECRQLFLALDRTQSRKSNSTELLQTSPKNRQLDTDGGFSRESEPQHQMTRRYRSENPRHQSSGLCLAILGV